MNDDEWNTWTLGYLIMAVLLVMIGLAFVTRGAYQDPPFIFLADALIAGDFLLIGLFMFVKWLDRPTFTGVIDGGGP